METLQTLYQRHFEFYENSNESIRYDFITKPEVVSSIKKYTDSVVIPVIPSDFLTELLYKEKSDDISSVVSYSFSCSFPSNSYPNVVLSETYNSDESKLTTLQIKKTSSLAIGTLGIYRHAIHQNALQDYGYVEELRIVTNVYLSSFIGTMKNTTNLPGITKMNSDKTSKYNIVITTYPVAKIIGNIAYYSNDKIIITYLEYDSKFYATLVGKQYSDNPHSCSFDPIRSGSHLFRRNYAVNGVLKEENGIMCNKNLNGMLPKQIALLYK